MDRESGQMFQKLYSYIQGGNTEGAVTKMTIPVFTFRHTNNEGMVDKISMCFWMNQDNQVLLSYQNFSCPFIHYRLQVIQNPLVEYFFGK